MRNVIVGRVIRGRNIIITQDNNGEYIIGSISRNNLSIISRYSAKCGYIAVNIYRNLISILKDY